MVTVLPPASGSEAAQWAQAGALGLSRAYADDEPKYSVTDVKG